MIHELNPCLQGRNWVILRGGAAQVYLLQEDVIIHGLSPGVKCVAPLLEACPQPRYEIQEGRLPSPEVAPLLASSLLLPTHPSRFQRQKCLCKNNQLSLVYHAVTAKRLYKLLCKFVRWIGFVIRLSQFRPLYLEHSEPGL